MLVLGNTRLGGMRDNSPLASMSPLFLTSSATPSLTTCPNWESEFCPCHSAAEMARSPCWNADPVGAASMALSIPDANSLVLPSRSTRWPASSGTPTSSFRPLLLPGGGVSGGRARRWYFLHVKERTLTAGSRHGTRVGKGLRNC